MLRFLLTPLLIGSILLISACSNLPERPEIGKDGRGRVGYLVEMERSPAHTHLSGGVFGGYVRPYPQSDWQLSKHAAESLARELLSRTQFVPVDLAALGYSQTDLDGLIVWDGETFQLPPHKATIAQRIKEEPSLDFIVLIKPATTRALNYCLPVGYCETKENIGMGLLTRSELIGYTYTGVLGAGFSIYSLAPVTDLAHYSTDRFPNMQFHTQFRKPQSWKQISEAEWQPLKQELLVATEDMATRIINTLLGIDAPCRPHNSTPAERMASGPRAACVRRSPVETDSE